MIALFMTNSAEFPVVWLGLARIGVVTAWVNFNQRNNVLGHSVNISKANSIIISPELQEGTANDSCSVEQRLVAAVAEAMAGGRLKIDYLPSGAVVKAFQVQDACHDGVLDCAHTVTAYWYGKNKAASLFGNGCLEPKAPTIQRSFSVQA